MSGRIRSLIFAAVLCLACSLLLAGASAGLKARQERNIAIDRQRNLLKSVGLVEPDRSYRPEEIEALFQASIQAVWADSAGRIIPESQHQPTDLPLYLYVEEDCIKAFIVPIDSRGLWGRIKGYLALEDDGSTIAGFTVYSHNETPGLGGEIEQNWFQKNFVGKRITDRNGNFVSVQIARGKAATSVESGARANYVDGISGASLTGKYLSSGLRTTLSRYEPMAIRFRKNPTCATPPSAGG